MGTDAGNAVDGVGPVVLAVHGGAGGGGRTGPDAADGACRTGLVAALDAGRAVLDGGGAAVDAAVEAVAALEDAEWFNAGRGSVYTTDATQELEAAVMDGASQAAGAVAGLTHVRNPVRLGRAVLDGSSHVLLTGRGAERFAADHGVELVDAVYFHSDDRLRALFDDVGRAGTADAGGTVGAVALDSRGRLAAATSTGGISGKAPGRVGDSPQIGAGTYADTNVAVSATGHGESLLRAVVGHEVAALLRHAGLSVTDAAERVMAEVGAVGGYGGLLALDAAGRLAAPFDTRIMPRGWLTRAGHTVTVGAEPG